MNEPHDSSSRNGASPDLVGQQIGDYRLLRRLGQGGMAEVYLARQESLQRQVAFKVLRSNLIGAESSVQRFHQEAQAAASLVHANIVQIYEVGCVDRVHFIAMEYVAGQNLQQLLKRHGALDAVRAVKIFRQVAAALQKAGQHGIIHRDIKPENILLSADGEVKVADFGLARVGDDETTAHLTQVGITMGTPLYMSPEQAEGGVLDPRSDIYSLGVTCYHMLVGRPPFEADAPLAIAVQHVKTQPDRLEDLRPDLPPGLCRIVHRMLAKRPEDRFAQASELMRELRGLQIEGLDDDWIASEVWDVSETVAPADTQVAATQQLEALMKRQSEFSPPRKRRAWLALLALGALLTGIGIAWLNHAGSILHVSEAELERAEQLETVEQQYLWATEVGTEQAWQSVWEYFPAEKNEKNRYYQRRSQQRLAELYVEQERYDEASSLYDALIGVDSTEVNIRVFAIAGKANVLALQGQLSEAKRLLAQVIPLLGEINSPRLRAEIRNQLHPRLSLEMERLLREYGAGERGS